MFDESQWLELRSRSLTPKHVSALVTTEQDRREFLEGMRMLRIDGPQALPGRRPLPHQLVVADMLAAGHKHNAVLMPRRSTKSTSAIATGVGRAEYREDYRVGIFTLTSGKAGRSRFLKDVAPHVERLYPVKSERPFRLTRIAGMEGLSFPMGGSINWLSTLDDIRGEAFDLLLLDESGEPGDPGYVSEVIAAALPTMDTRPGAQLVVLGTAGRFRAGNLLWDALELGRNGTGGIVEYSAPDGVTDEQLEDWEPTEENPYGRVRELVELGHPSVHVEAVQLESIHENYKSLGPEKFSREYLGIFGVVGETAGIIDAGKWAELGTGSDIPAPPADFALAFAPHPDQLSASIMAAWRDKKGRAHILMLEHKKTVKWLAPEAARLARKYMRRITFDAGSQVSALVAEDLSRSRPRPRLDPRAFPDVKKAAALLVQEIENGNLTHYRQPELDLAARKALKRMIGPTAWAFGRGKEWDLDITPLEAGALALLAYDQARPNKQPAPTITFSAA